MSIVADTVQFLDTPGGQPREREQDDGIDSTARRSGEPGADRELAGVGAGSEDAELVF